MRPCNSNLVDKLKSILVSQKSFQRKYSSSFPSSVVTNKERECFVSFIENSDINAHGIAIIALNRPSRKNAFGKTMIDQLYECIQYVGESKARTVILKSLVERCFSAGADLKERLVMSPEQVGPFVSKLQNTFGLVEKLSIPTIAAIDGVALGGGCELALCCDLRYAGPNAKIGLVETKLAILPAAGGSQRLPRLIGASKAKELIFTAAILDFEQAAAYGVVNKAVKNETAYDLALSVATKICENGPLAIKYVKQAIEKGLEADLETGLYIEKNCYAQLIPTKDRLEGLAAFKEGRKPIYVGS